MERPFWYMVGGSLLLVGSIMGGAGLDGTRCSRRIGAEGAAPVESGHDPDAGLCVDGVVRAAGGDVQPARRLQRGVNRRQYRRGQLPPIVSFSLAVLLFHPLLLAFRREKRDTAGMKTSKENGAGRTNKGQTPPSPRRIAHPPHELRSPQEPGHRCVCADLSAWGDSLEHASRHGEPHASGFPRGTFHRDRDRGAFLRGQHPRPAEGVSPHAGALPRAGDAARRGIRRGAEQPVPARLRPDARGEGPWGHVRDWRTAYHGDDQRVTAWHQHDRSDASRRGLATPDACRDPGIDR
jgi:hypothetical protein